MNAVQKIKLPNGQWVEDVNQIRVEAEKYFQDQLKSKRVIIDEELLSCIPSLVSEDDNQFLTAEPSEEEIKDAVFSIPLDSAPGPDGVLRALLSELLGDH